MRVADALTIHCATSAVAVHGARDRDRAVAPPDDRRVLAGGRVDDRALHLRRLRVLLAQPRARQRHARLEPALPDAADHDGLGAADVRRAGRRRRRVAGIGVCLAAVAIVRLQPSAARSAAPTSARRGAESSAAPSQRQKPWIAPS